MASSAGNGSKASESIPRNVHSAPSPPPPPPRTAKTRHTISPSHARAHTYTHTFETKKYDKLALLAYLIHALCRSELSAVSGDLRTTATDFKNTTRRKKQDRPRSKPEFTWLECSTAKGLSLLQSSAADVCSGDGLPKRSFHCCCCCYVRRSLAPQKAYSKPRNQSTVPSPSSAASSSDTRFAIPAAPAESGLLLLFMSLLLLSVSESMLLSSSSSLLLSHCSCCHRRRYCLRLRRSCWCWCWCQCCCCCCCRCYCRCCYCSCSCCCRGVTAGKYIINEDCATPPLP